MCGILLSKILRRTRKEANKSCSTVLNTIPWEKSRFLQTVIGGLRLSAALKNFKIGTEKDPYGDNTGICNPEKAAAMANHRLGKLDEHAFPSYLLSAMRFWQESLTVISLWLYGRPEAAPSLI